MSPLKYTLRSLLLGLACAALFVAPVHAATDSPPDRAAAIAQADAALARADLADYRGWLKFLRLEAETAIARHGATSEAAQAKIARLTDWSTRITADPQLLAKLRDVQEWAYESPVDGSGQPFKMAIPTDYDPAKPAALSVYMHGYSGNHLEHSTGMVSRPGVFHLAVLGRSRAGGYRALSEADVLHVIDYVQAHWAIDPSRIHLNGGSMGGGGTYRLGSRYPHRWASGRPTCGYASHLPFGNLLTFPIYATHSADDPVVSVLHQRGPLARVRALGGQAVLDETNGLGHAAWDFAEGNARGEAWVQRQVRPDSRSVRHIDYTALDGIALRGWWGEITEWGDAPKPARFVLSAGAANTLYATLTNISRLRLRLAESPFDRNQPLHVSVNGGVLVTLSAPLPEHATLVHAESGWSFESAAPAISPRLHTPGSASLLYNGEPLLIVYGTRGNEAERVALRAAAEAASKSPNPIWLDDSGELGPDGVPHPHMTYGRLNVKPDADVTEADIARCHLVLIGSAAQNRLVERLAAKLPVRFAGGAIACSDGVNFRGEHYALGLVHYNPLAPDRLIFWVASDDVAAYGPRCPIPQLIGGGALLNNTPSATDLVIADLTHSTLVAARSFDRRWNWSRDRESSPVIPDAMKTNAQMNSALAHAIRRAAGCDFALTERSRSPEAPAVVPGVTRVADVVAGWYYQPIGVASLTGAELTRLAQQLATPEAPLQLTGPSAASLEGVKSEAICRVAIPTYLVGALTGYAKILPQTYEHTDLGVAEALERFLLTP